jgi:hypothetical protein
MTITLDQLQVENKTRKNADGTETPYRRICVTLRNDGDTAEEQKVTFHRVVTSGAGQSATTRLCSSGPKPVPPKQKIVRPTYTAEADGTEVFCCDIEGEEDGSDFGFGTVKLWAEAGAPPKDKTQPLEIGQGRSDHKTLVLHEGK